MDTGIHIGNAENKDGVSAVAEALMRFLQSGAEQKTIRAAITAFSRVAEVKNVSMHDCNVIGGDVGVTNAALEDAIARVMDQASAPETDTDAMDEYDYNT